MELIQDNVMIELEHIGEGWSGDYDEYDEMDDPLLRFTVFVRGTLVEKLDCEPSFEDWYAVNDCSYCTQLPDDVLSDEQKQKALQILMNEVQNTIESGSSLKKACEYLSWIEPKDLK